jgi:sensor domain CHASE-containing protein
LNNHEARIKDLEEFSGNDNLGNKKFDSVDTQNLKVNGENIDASDLAKKSEMSVTPGTGANADKSTIQLKNGTSAVVLTRHQDISGKQDALTFMTNDEVDALFANAWGATT